MKTIPLVLSLCAVFLVCHERHGVAGEPDDRKNLEAARTSYEQGVIHYNLGEFAEAIAEFKHAYQLSGAPDLLFNIAQAYRLSGDYKQALYFYETFLREHPDAANRSDVESRIAEMRRLQEERKEVQGSVEDTTVPPTETLPRTQGASASAPPARSVLATSRSAVTLHRGSSKRIAGLAIGGGGTLLLATSLYFAFDARSGWDDVNALAVEGGTWDDRQQGTYDRASRSESVAKVLAASGALALLAGGAFYLWGWREDRAERVVDIVANPERAEVTITWRF